MATEPTEKSSNQIGQTPFFLYGNYNIEHLLFLLNDVASF